MSSRRRKFLLLFLSLAIWPLGELILRVRGFEYPPFEVPIQIWNAGEDAQLDDEGALHRFDRAHFWLPREGAEIAFAPGERVSSQGFRGQDPDPSARFRVLVLGDSSTFGWGIRDEETFARRLEAFLDRDLRDAGITAAPDERLVQVVNGGVIGSTARQGVVRYRELARSWTPHLVIEAFAGMNEHVPTFDYDDVEKQAWLEDRDTLGYRLRRFPRENLRIVHLAFWFLDEARGGREEVLRDSMMAELERRKELQGFESLAEYKKRVPPSDFIAALSELDQMARANGGRLVCVRAGRTVGGEARRSAVVQYDAALRAFAEQSGVLVVDACARLRELAATGIPEGELFLDEAHPTARGHAAVAELLADEAGPIAVEIARGL